MDDSPLNSWFRQQGGDSFYKTQTSFPKLTNKYHKEIILPRIKSNLKSTASQNLNKSPSHSKNVYFVTSNESFMSQEFQRDLKTPLPSNFYYQQCIDDVYKCNQPEQHKLKIPRELTYVQSIPNFKYVTVGCGKTFNCMWQISVVNKA
ncbi:unnamed protein product [Brachionus calyciflorus]|uniref:Uncharacterized protein n=1 Tax=Brachionus calyciflorus TaxID=104777 RepID=A0A813M2W1_9BILA|nr:unnamed protein product [Brachionus calyciflorus]